MWTAIPLATRERSSWPNRRSWLAWWLDRRVSDLRGHAGGPIGLAGATALASSPALAKCAALDLTGNDLGDAGLAALVNSPQLAELRVLKLGRNQITDAGIVAIRDALPSLLARLRILDLSENRLTRYGMGVLEAAKGQLPISLDLSGNVQVGIGQGPDPAGEGGDGEEHKTRPLTRRKPTELRRRVAYPRIRPGDRHEPSELNGSFLVARASAGHNPAYIPSFLTRDPSP